jgi:Bax protein
MRQNRTGLKSNKILTLMGFSLALLYALPEMMPVSKMSFVNTGPGQIPIEEEKLAGLPTVDTGSIPVPVPALRPTNLPTIIQPHQNDVSTLLARWNDSGFDLQAIRRGAEVPHEFIDQIPVDILDIENTADRKRVFLSVVLPHILAINHNIQEERSRLIQVMSAREKSGGLRNADDEKWLSALAQKYGVKADDFNELKKRVNIIPPSLALAQGVEESGWGTSRFAREGNAIYGQRIWETGAGIIPVEREAGEKFEVRAFNGISDSIRGYMHNLNSYFAYEEFRSLRDRQTQTKDVNGHELATTLIGYSERAEKYVETIQTLIQSNRFDNFDKAKLLPGKFAGLFMGSED